MQESGLLRPAGFASFQFCPFEQRLAEFVDHLVIFAEVKAAFVEFGVTVFKNAAVFGDGFGATDGGFGDDPFK